MKKMTTFFTIALLVCIAICVAFAGNQNRDRSVSYVYPHNPDEDLPGPCKSVYNYGSDSEGPLSSSGYSYTGYWLNENEENKIRFGANASGYVSCSTDNDNYRTTYKLYAKVPSGLQFPNERNPETLPKFGSFSESVSRAGEGNGMSYAIGGASGSASASGKNPSNGAQHTTSAASPTPVTARELRP